MFADFCYFTCKYFYILVLPDFIVIVEIIIALFMIKCHHIETLPFSNAHEQNYLSAFFNQNFVANTKNEIVCFASKDSEPSP